DEDVEPAEPLDVPGDDAHRGILVGEVRGDRLRPEPGRGRLDLLGRPGGERELVALLAEHPGDREADARRAACDERALHTPTLEESRGPGRTDGHRTFLSPDDGGFPGR